MKFLPVGVLRGRRDVTEVSSAKRSYNNLYRSKLLTNLT